MLQALTPSPRVQACVSYIARERTKRPPACSSEPAHPLGVVQTSTDIGNVCRVAFRTKQHCKPLDGELLTPAHTGYLPSDNICFQ